MKQLLLYIFLVSVFTVHAQLRMVPLMENHSQQSETPSSLRIASNNSADTLSLPFIDDFSTSFLNPDTSLYLNEGGVYVNNHYPVKPPSINVATFDGIASNGFPYVFPDVPGSSISVTGIADYLVSKPIDLSAFSVKDSLGFSFYWQIGALHPSLNPNLDKGDSLKLYFKDMDSVWVQVWPQTTADSVELADYTNENGFNYKFIRFESTDFMHNSFQFKFESNGILTGNWTMWSVDYIYLDSNRISQNVQDFAFGGQVSSLLDGYTAVPYSQYITNPDLFLNDTIATDYNNLSSANNFRDSIAVTIYDSSYLGTNLLNTTKQLYDITIAQTSNINIETDLNSAAIKTYIDQSGRDEFILSYNMQLTGADQEELFKTNDIISDTNYITNYIARDDGTAEAAISGSFSDYAQVAYQFELVAPDTLTSIFFQWSRSGFDLTGVPINVKVWKSLKGVDGATEDDQLITVNTIILYGETFDAFTRVDLSSEIILQPGKFYVGWDQFFPDKEIRIATDMSKDNTDKLYLYNSSGWKQPTLVYGSPLIRPKFGYKGAHGMEPVGFEDGYNSRTGFNGIQVYPNPANNEVTIKGELQHLVIYSVTGNIIWETSFDEIKKEYTINTTDLDDGLYIIEASNPKGSFSQRLTINH